MKAKGKILAAICGIMTCMPIHAQRVTYSYDAGGNRTLKKIIIISSEAKAGVGEFDESDETAAVANVLAKDEGVSINTTDDGRVTINICDAVWSGEATIIVYASNGIQLIEEHTATQVTQIDLSCKPSGIYMLTVKMGRRTRTWKLLIR